MEENGEVIENYYRVRGGEILKEANDLCAAGKYDEAQKLLTATIEKLINCKVYNKSETLLELNKDLMPHTNT